MNFSRLKYDVSIAKDRPLIEVYPELADYPEFEDVRYDHVLKCVVLMMDEESPFVKLYRDNYENRIDNVFHYLEIDDSTFKGRVNRGEDPRFNLMTFKYFMMMDNLSYTSWMSLFMNYHYQALFLRQPPDFNDMEKSMEKRSKIEKELPNMLKRLSDFETQIFVDAKQRKIVKQQVAKITQFPEQMAVEKQVI